jgi:glycosyltransferase involved in cell wall biosynthesis
LKTFRPLREEKLRSDVVRIVFVGRIERIKGLSNLLRAVEILKRSRPTARMSYEIVGKAYEPEYYSELLQYKRAKHLDDIVFKGFVDNLPALYQNADIFVFPCLHGTGQGGAVNIEAMASGLPIVATSVGGIPEIVAEGTTGFLVPPNDPETLAVKLGVLIDDEKLRREMGHLGRQRAESLFSIEGHTKMMIQIYNELT